MKTIQTLIFLIRDNITLKNDAKIKMIIMCMAAQLGISEKQTRLLYLETIKASLPTEE